VFLERRTPFFAELKEAELAIRPFCEASFLMQRDGNTPCDVFVVYVNLYLHLNKFSSLTTYEDAIVKDLQSRWSLEEQHVFFLSFILHPKYWTYAASMINGSEEKNGNWTYGKNIFSANRLVTAAKLYFGKHQLHIDCMKNSVSGFEKKNFLKSSLSRLHNDLTIWIDWHCFDSGLTHEDYQGGHPVEFWAKRAREHNELSHLARFLLSAVVQSASCERIFKSWMLFQTKFRNPLLPHKTQGMNRVRRELSRKRREESGRMLTARQTAKPRKSKNRFVNPEERKTVLEKRLTTVNTLGVDQDDEEGDADVEEFDDEDEDDNSNDDIEKYDLLCEWKQTLAHIQEDEEDEDEGQLFEDDSEEHGSSVPVYECFEETDEDLEPLPEDNNPNYPQENKIYFASKKGMKNYVRNDKMSLQVIHGIIDWVKRFQNKDFPMARKSTQMKCM
jgi:hypothetical protein